MKLQDIHLTPSRAGFVRRCMDSGRFDSISEIIHEALGLLELHSENEEVRLCVLRAELQKGFDDYEAGRHITFESKDDMKKHFEERRRLYRERLAVEQDDV